jgi:transcription elongation factor SPT5
MLRLASASASTPILSAFVRPSLKGRLYVEAKSALDMRKACSGLLGVMVNKLAHVPIDEALPLLQLDTHFFSVDVGDWVRMKSGLYRQDLAVVLDVFQGGTGMKVALMPRLDLSSDPNGKRKCSSRFRPSKRLFNEQEIVRALGPESITRCNQIFMFRKQEFKNGLLELEVELDDLIPELATPSKSELREFIQSSTLDSKSVNLAFVRIIRNLQASLKSGDRVIVMLGESQGKIGVIKSVRGNIATLCIGDQHPDLEILTSTLDTLQATT